MTTRLVIEGNAFYEIDEDCIKRRERRAGEQTPMSRSQGRQTGGEPAEFEIESEKPKKSD